MLGARRSSTGGGGARAQPHQGSSKASFKAARKDAKLECSVECRRHKEEHCRRFANKSVPARGFHHLPTCPLKLEADRQRRKRSASANSSAPSPSCEVSE